MKKCNNENIIHLYDFVETTNNYYFVTEYCNEGDLE